MKMASKRCGPPLEQSSGGMVEKWEVLLATWFPDEVVVYLLYLLLLCTTA